MYVYLAIVAGVASVLREYTVAFSFFRLLYVDFAVKCITFCEMFLLATLYLVICCT